MRCLITGLLLSATDSGAFAGEVASPKPGAPRDIRICDGYGPSFFYSPGTDSCIKVGGVVMSEVRGLAAAFRPRGLAAPVGGFAPGPAVAKPLIRERTGVTATGRLELDVRQQTEYGPFRAFVRVNPF